MSRREKEHRLHLETTTKRLQFCISIQSESSSRGLKICVSRWTCKKGFQLGLQESQNFQLKFRWDSSEIAWYFSLLVFGPTVSPFLSHYSLDLLQEPSHCMIFPRLALGSSVFAKLPSLSWGRSAGHFHCSCSGLFGQLRESETTAVNGIQQGPLKTWMIFECIKMYLIQTSSGMQTDN